MTRKEKKQRKQKLKTLLGFHKENLDSINLMCEELEFNGCNELVKVRLIKKEYERFENLLEKFIKE